MTVVANRPSYSRYVLGQMVFWTSQSAGVIKEKSGKVMEVVAAGQLPCRQKFSSLYKGAGVGMPRNHESYVVGVDVGRTPGASVKYYWPRASSLAKVTAEQSIHVTSSESDLLVRLATSKRGRLSLSLNPPASRAVNGLLAKKLAVQDDDELVVTDLGQNRCTTIY